MNCFYLTSSAQAKFPKKADNKFVKDVLYNFTMGNIADCTFCREDNLITIGNAEAKQEPNMDFTISVGVEL